MPGPGERDDDDLVGFSNPGSLEGRRRGDGLAQTPPVSEDALFAPRPAGPHPHARSPAPDAVAVAPRPFAGAERRRATRPAESPETFRLYTAYALMLFTVPTLGLAGLIALIAVWKRARMGNGLAESHALFQKRTLLAASGAAVAGVVLMAAPFALGVPILFLTALWLILRAAVGVWMLKADRAIANPRGWWI